MNERERQNLKETIKAMSREELLTVAECIPAEICIARIQGELERLQAVEGAIAEIMQGQKGQI